MLRRNVWTIITLVVTSSAWAGDPEALGAQAAIHRDTFGVPHIVAETEEAAAYAYGYAAAEDRVELMAKMYLKGRGEAAKQFGKEMVTSDLWVKRLRNVKAAQDAYERMSPHFRAYVDAYAAGYNRYLEHHRAELEEWIQPVTGIEIVAHCRRVVILEFCMNLRQIARIDGLLKEQEAAAESQITPGSNMWAINKERSESGNALLLGNPHLAWSDSHVWHEVQITVPNAMNFMGASLVGFPGPGLGFNDRLGWSHTVNPHDCDDIYELTLDPNDAHRYLYEGRSVPMSKETISVDVKTDSGIETQTEDVYWTHYGPVVKFKEGKAYAYKSPNIEGAGFLEQWHLMSKAKTLGEFRRILDMQGIPMFNIAYADAEGNCFYVCNGRFPDRPQGYRWDGIVEGGTAKTEWSWILPEQRLPFALNPPGGYVQNCNSAPWYTTMQAIIDRHGYPAEVFPNSNSLRTQHSLELLEGNASVSLEELKRDKFSMKLLLADRVKPDLIRLAEAKGPEFASAVAVLQQWDNSVARESKGAVLFVEFWKTYRAKAKPIFKTDWDEQRPASTPYGIGDAQMAVVALAEAGAEVTKAHGALDVAWGDVSRLRHEELDIPVGGYIGDFGAFRIIESRPSDDGKLVAVGGDSYVFAVEFSQPVKAYSILAYSQSGDPKSPHYTDQCALFADNQFKPTWFHEEDLAKNTERAYRVTPEGIELVNTKP